MLRWAGKQTNKHWAASRLSWMKLFSSRCRSHLRSPSVSTRVWPVPLPQPTLLKVGHPPLAVTLRVLRLTSERQLAECLHPAVMCFWLDPPPTKGWAQGKAQRQRISGGVNKRYTLQLGRVVCVEARCVAADQQQLAGLLSIFLIFHRR